jgi:hypothetical protein
LHSIVILTFFLSFGGQLRNASICLSLSYFNSCSSNDADARPWYKYLPDVGCDVILYPSPPQVHSERARIPPDRCLSRCLKTARDHRSLISTYSFIGSPRSSSFIPTIHMSTSSHTVPCPISNTSLITARCCPFLADLYDSAAKPRLPRNPSVPQALEPPVRGHSGMPLHPHTCLQH